MPTLKNKAKEPAQSGPMPEKKRPGRPKGVKTTNVRVWFYVSPEQAKQIEALNLGSDWFREMLNKEVDRLISR